jgi:hypothetical protein
MGIFVAMFELRGAVSGNSMCRQGHYTGGTIIQAGGCWDQIDKKRY